MTLAPRLSSHSQMNADVQVPAYDPVRHGVGIVHLGLGAFHRAHQAVYTDAALAAAGGDWRIVGVSLRSATAAEQLNPQQGRYTVMVRSTAGTTARVIAAIDRVLTAPQSPAEVLKVMTAVGTRIVSLTVTEKAYGIDRATQGVDLSHPAVRADLAAPEAPTGVLGLLVEALRRRRAAGLAPFTVLCCDNLPENGVLLHNGVVDFARQFDPDLADWIGQTVSFPSTMVDRITPAATARTYADVTALTGHQDLGAVETEPFSQWVIEDRFPTGRPAWERAGAIFVADVQPYELMKLRMLNGAHSMLAYVGGLAGCTYVRDVMADPALAALVDRHMRAAQATLPHLPAVDLDHYRAELLARFANTAIAHRTDQIAMDGSEKLPQRILAPALETLQLQGDVAPFAFAVAGWMAFCVQAGPGLDDPRAAEIRAALAPAQTAVQISAALHDLHAVFPGKLRDSQVWRKAVVEKLDVMLQQGGVAAAKVEK
ncbi:mannitol dehydrogenase family protein [Tritonibacter horizontis]|uniref:Polyol:NADP oxidoreductase n=1 Tax=Tritonibacter horizontis TaxID=1768241 RepID=A0A132BQ69_9RHOB|nr:mannitol dehydrogenase family protein [Tritonibacter horizontis]KUP90553.1 polyol:NADP oxidoreductase [Tritonibacter horizontis]